MAKADHRQWLSPFVAVTFCAVAISAFFLLLHQKSAGIHQLHQWAGMLFLLGGVLHVLLNWRVFISYFPKKRAVLGAVAGLAAIVFFVALFPSIEHGGTYQGRGYDTQRTKLMRHGIPSRW